MRSIYTIWPELSKNEKWVVSIWVAFPLLALFCAILQRFLFPVFADNAALISLFGQMLPLHYVATIFLHASLAKNRHISLFSTVLMYLYGVAVFMTALFIL